jgi:SAM-dependent methyltransferase
VGGLILKYLDRWYEQPLGAAFAQIQKNEIKALLPQLRGNRLLYLGLNPGVDLKAEEIASYYVSLTSDVALEQAEPFVVGAYHALPFLPDSIDVVLMNQVLEFESNLKHVLEEIHRILTAEGKVMIMGFNAFSLWGLIHFLKRRRDTLPWRGEFHTPFELKHALLNLKFDILVNKTFFFRPPIQNSYLLNHLKWFEKLGPFLLPQFGAGYLLIAQKKVIGLTPLRSRWQFSESVPERTIKSAARTS